MYPLRFKPIFRHYLWGGQRLGSVLGKHVPRDETVAESWEVVDRHGDQSVIQFGELAGQSLQQLVQQRGKQLLGRHHPLESFPLLFKFLDAKRDLSVQVHPNDEQALRQNPPDLGKTEAWLIMDAEPDSYVYAGLQAGIESHRFQEALQDGNIDQCLHKVLAQPGDCFFIPAGTVHALGAGLLVAEIQQASDTTFRLFDWNRTDANGKSRQLHIEQGLAVTDFQRGPIQPRRSSVTPSNNDATAGETLVRCDKFVLQRRWISEETVVGGDDRCHIVVTCNGAIDIENDPSGNALSAGQVALIPAALPQLSLMNADKGPSEVLDIYLP